MLRETLKELSLAGYKITGMMDIINSFILVRNAAKIASDSLFELHKDFYQLLYSPSKRVSYLAEHASKKRVRKKNTNRIIKNMNKLNRKETNHD